VSDPLKHHSARRAIAIGGIVFGSSLVLMLLPLLIPLGAGAKYLVAIAFVGAIAGLSIMLNGVIDYLRSRR
jgi:hypothetical protein